MSPWVAAYKESASSGVISATPARINVNLCVFMTFTLPRLMRAMIHESTNRIGMVLRVLRRRPNRLLATAASVGTTDQSPTVAFWRFDNRPSFALGVLQCGFDFFFGVPGHIRSSFA